MGRGGGEILALSVEVVCFDLAVVARLSLFVLTKGVAKVEGKPDFEDID